MRRIYFIWAVVAAMSGLGAASARAEFTDWTSAGATSSGTLGSTNVSLSNLGPPVSGTVQIGTFNFTTAEYAFAPASVVSTEEIEYGHGTDWTVNFDQPVVNLLVYCVAWRPISVGVPTGGTTSYEFTQPFTIAPGSAGGNATITNGQTALPADTLELSGNPSNFFKGILIFPGPITTLSLNSSETTAGNPVGVTFGTVPEPSIATSVALACAALFTRCGRRGHR